jgi:hypothetical protein
MEPRGCKRWQSVANRIDAIAAKTSKTVATGCDRLPKAAHGKERVCHRLPPAAESPLSVKEGVDLLAPQDAKSCEPEGPQDLTARL